MNKKVQSLLVATFIICLVFAIAAVIVFGYGFIYIVAQKDFPSVLAEIYSFFHTCIAIFAAFMAFRAMKNKKSVIMRTIMYKNDYRELTPSVIARVFFIILGALGLFLGIYFTLSFFINAPGMAMWEFPHVLKVVLIEVGFYLFLIGTCFVIFPFLYDINVDIEERKNKYLRKEKKENNL